ncbi:MAG: diaminopimelate decarboxylase [Deltaproteobacteria bacterium]|nr:diaminopimelate decarboxylase [Deltaproteobacteria bacterium]
MHHFEYGSNGTDGTSGSNKSTGSMRAEGVDLERIAEAVGTPTYVYSEATIRRHFAVYDEAFSGHPHLICYAVKANTNASILRVLAEMGAGADIVSEGELFRALRAGIPPERIVFSGVGKTAREMAVALDAGILAFNVESEPELHLLAQVASKNKRTAHVSLRVNPDVDAKTHPYISTGLKESKFGIPIGDARRIAAMAKTMAHVDVVGVDCHIGSQLTSLAPIMEALDSVLALVDALVADGHRIREVDLGGGLGIPYDAEKASPPLPRELGAGVIERFRGRQERIILEPGRVIVGNAGVLLTRVLYVKKTADRTFVVVDAAMNDLMRPALYQAHHEILPVRKATTDQDERQVLERVDVVGPICESSDAFARQRALPVVAAGDLLAIMSAGAYGFSMASTYNSRPRAAEVMVNGEAFHVIRDRESIEALVASESFAPWLNGGGAA